MNDLSSRMSKIKISKIFVGDIFKHKHVNNQDIINDELHAIVANMKIKDSKSELINIIKKIENCNTLTEQCVLARAYLAPQSTQFETIIRNRLLIEKAKNETSGDGCKNNINYEIKHSIHAKTCKINFVQIRPDHDIDYYIFIAYNMYYDDKIGKAYLFKIPSEIVYKLIIKYGGYAHGTKKILGKITPENIKGRNYEYALRCDPNCKKSKKSKNNDLWNEFLKYETNYEDSLF